MVEGEGAQTGARSRRFQAAPLELVDGQAKEAIAPVRVLDDTPPPAQRQHHRQSIVKPSMQALLIDPPLLPLHLPDEAAGAAMYSRQISLARRATKGRGRVAYRPGSRI